MQAKNASQRTISGCSSLVSAGLVVRLLALALSLVFLLTPCAFAADDVDLGQVEKITPNDRDESQNPDMVNYYQNNKGSKWHLWKRPDGSYYLKGKGFKAEISGAKVRTGLGQTYQIPDNTGNQPVDNFNRDVRDFIKTAIGSSPSNSPAAGDSFFPLNLSTALAMEGDQAGLWQDRFTKTSGVVGFDMVSNELSILGSATADGTTPVVYSFDASTQDWVLNVFGDGTEFTFGEGTGPHPGGDFTAGWVYGMTPEPGTLLLVGSGVLGLSGYLRKRLLLRS